MTTRTTIALLASTIFATLPACQMVFGVEERKLDPVPEGCSLPTEGAGRLRLANLAPVEGAIDACVRKAGGSYGRPIFRGGGRGAACTAGLSYPEVTRAIPVPAGAIDVKLVAAGQTCSGPALAELRGIDTTGGPSVTVVRYHAPDGSEAATASADSPPPSGPEAVQTRVGNFLVGSTSVFVGVAAGSRLPQTITSPLVQGIPFGGYPAANAAATFGKVDGNGYLVMPTNDYNLAVVETGSTDARFVAKIERRSVNFSLFAIGNAHDLRFPPRGLLCDDGLVTEDDLRTVCRETDLPALTIETWNAGLYGAFAVEEAARRPFVIQEIAKRGSDLLCLSEVARKSDREAIAQAALAGGFAYSHTAETDLDTKATDPTDASGATPPASTEPPCSGVAQKAVDDAYACMVANCSERPGDPTGAIAGGTSCLSEKCAAELLPLLAGSRADKKCFDCAIVNAVSYTSFADNQRTCTTDVRDAYAWNGEAPVMVLSRYPLLEKESYVFASTNWRRVILHSKVEIEKGKPLLDYFCTQISPIVASMPYVGRYSANEDETGWMDEQALQAQKLVAWVKERAGSAPAIVTGDLSSSIEFPDTPLGAQNPRVHDALASAFELALPASVKPSCTRCPRVENPYNGDAKPLWTLRTYLWHFPKDATQTATRFFTESIVPLSSGETGPLSDTFGWSVGVLRP